MILKHILYKYISIWTADNILAILTKYCIILCLILHTIIRLLLAHQLNEQQEIYMT